jgi:hypothetical protein
MHEVEVARQNDIGIIVMIDNDKYNQREIIEKYTKIGCGYLFSSQVIGFSSEYRAAGYEKLAHAIKRAVATRQPNQKSKNANASADVHAHATSDEIFRSGVLEKWGSAEDAWRVFNQVSEGSDGLSRSDFKAMLAMLRIKLPKEETKKLRRQMDPENSKIVNKPHFIRFIKRNDGNTFISDDDTAAAKSGDSESAFLAKLPVDMPSLPDNYRHRPDVEHQIFDLLMDKAPCKGSTCAVHGMVSRPLQFLSSLL